jgi:hypothetical protein
MKRSSSTDGRLKGVYLRGKKYWHRSSYQGHQYRAPLDRESESDAITKGVRIRVHPLLTEANPLAEEIKNYLADKQEKGTCTRNSADSRAPVRQGKDINLARSRGPGSPRLHRACPQSGLFLN